jgi:hypothetical protein
MRRHRSLIAFGTAVAVTACVSPSQSTGYPVTTFSFAVRSDDALHIPIVEGILETAGLKDISMKGRSGQSSRELRIGETGLSVTMTLVDRQSRPKCVSIVVAPGERGIAEAEKLAVSLRTDIEVKGEGAIVVYLSSDCVFDS